MTAVFTDLIRRLKSQHEHGLFRTPLPVAGYGEAAVAIETLMQRVTELEAALKPFAETKVSIDKLKDGHLVRVETLAWNIRVARGLLEPAP